MTHTHTHIHMFIIYYICVYKSNNKQNSKTIITTQSFVDV